MNFNLEVNRQDRYTNAMKKTHMYYIILLVASSDALAYVDPGTGLLMWQGLIAAIGAIAATSRAPYIWLRRAIRKLFGKPYDPES